MPRTLADMTADGRRECVGMWADAPGNTLVIIAAASEPNVSWVVIPQSKGDGSPLLNVSITPRFDLQRAWTPCGEPVGAKLEPVKANGMVNPHA